MEKYFGKKDASVGTRESRVEQKRPRIELNMDEIVADPDASVGFMLMTSLIMNA